MTELKLSSLQNGQLFRFKGGQIAKYLLNVSSGNAPLREMPTHEHIVYRVVKKNDITVKVETEFKTMEYIFKFGTGKPKTVNDGLKFTGVDCLIELI